MIGTLLAGGLKSVVAVVVVFLVLVTIHEFGHFIVAKKAGVLVPRFAIGFGPALFRFGKGETEYSIRLFPLGGYVQLAGEIPQDTFFKLGERIAVTVDDKGEVTQIAEPQDLPDGLDGNLSAIDTQRSFTLTLATDEGVQRYPISRHAVIVTGKDPIVLAPPDRQMGQKPLYARMLIVLAGPVMNVLLTIVLFAVVAGVIGTPVSPPQIASVLAHSPAYKAGMRAGDVVTAIDGQTVTSWPQFVIDVQEHPGAKLVLRVVRDGTAKSLTVVPEKDSAGNGFIGVVTASNHSIGTSIVGGVQETGQYTQMIYGALGQLFTHRSAFVKDTAGPVKIVTIIGQQAQNGILSLVNLTAILSLNLAIFNLLPIPALDGSRLLFMIVEWIRGKPVDPRKEYMVHAIGFALLILFTVFRTYLDVSQLL
ncbi:MAG: RIP metalloprotease RseP [Firmicutes bacterium]|nr:RIP metalloprotease RseP [Bacillota bacterium]